MTEIAVPDWIRETPRKELAMRSVKIVLVCLVSVAIGALLSPSKMLIAGEASKYPLDDKFANEPAPWTVKGKWGERGNWGRWGEEDKRGMLNYITP
jgi:hypothetical protein